MRSITEEKFESILEFIDEKKIDVLEPNSTIDVSITQQPGVGDHSYRVVVLTDDNEIIVPDTEKGEITKTLKTNINWTPWIILTIIVIVIIVFIIILLAMIIRRNKRIREKKEETIKEIELKFKKAKKLGLPTGELRELLKKAKKLK